MKNEVSLRELQLAELEILKEFIKISKELNLKYFLDSGTLLGCIRHKGFIPWDDDIDVSMPREDYEIFIEKAQELLNNKYFLQTYETDNEYTQSFAKIRNSETTFIESTVKNSNINHGIYIDIFPFDGYNPKKKLHNIKVKIITTINRIYISKKYNLKNPERLKIKILRVLQTIIGVTHKNKSMQQLLKKEETEFKKYKFKENKYVCCYSFNEPSPAKHYMPREYFGEGITKVFEGIEVNVPINYDGYLTRLYGDYMKLPPEEKRIAHHYNEVIDLNKSYREYIEKDNSIKI